MASFTELEVWKHAKKIETLSETLDHLLIALDEKIITNEILQNFQIEYDSCLRLLNGYIQYLKKKKVDELT